jgi:UDP-N-acetylglucosamine 2-epimerase (non-hydrolysing)
MRISEMTPDVIYIVGARPNFIKLAPLIKSIKGEVDFKIVHTGQHYDYEMNELFFRELDLPDPDYHLGVGSGSHGYQTGEMLIRIERVLEGERPKLVIVLGDTNTTLAGALAAVKLKIDVGHVEAGVRSHERFMPEEINRVLVDHMSSLLFAPTQRAVANLQSEGIRENIFLVGDVMFDSFLIYHDIAKRYYNIMEELGLKPKDYLLLTVHRAENTDSKERLSNILEAVSGSPWEVIFPAHPRTIAAMKRFSLIERIERVGNVRIIKPLGYLEMLVLEENAKKILTDSGGVQKEAYFLRIPCITLRERTEWMETVEEGWNVLVGADKSRISNAIMNFDGSERYNQYIFGNGGASDRITSIIKDFLRFKD